MRTVFEQRCDAAWRAHEHEDLRLSLHLLRRDRAISDTRATTLYVIRDAAADAIKIGTTDRPAMRLSNLGVGNPNPLELVLAVAAPAGLEPALHAYLAADLLRGEWYATTARVLVAIELLSAAVDFQRDLERDGEQPSPDLTLEVLCTRANQLLDVLEAAA